MHFYLCLEFADIILFLQDRIKIKRAWQWPRKTCIPRLCELTTLIIINTLGCNVELIITLKNNGMHIIHQRTIWTDPLPLTLQILIQTSLKPWKCSCHIRRYGKRKLRFDSWRGYRLYLSFLLPIVGISPYILRIWARRKSCLRISYNLNTNCDTNFQTCKKSLK